MQEYKDAVREHLSSYVCQLRQRHGLTQEEMAESFVSRRGPTATWNVENSAFPPRH